MGLFDKLFGKPGEFLPKVHAEDGDIVAPCDGELIDVKSLPDPMFADELLGKSAAVRLTADNVTICAPANGVLRALFPTGHAFGIETGEGVEILVHIGIDTVNSNGDGFKLCSKKIGDRVEAGDPIVKVDVKKLSAKYNMSTIVIITEDNGKSIEFLAPQKISRGQSILKI